MSTYKIAEVGYMRIPVPHGMGILTCEICGSDIGIFDPHELADPITASMFKAVGPGFPPPFYADPAYPFTSSWEALWCPVCRRRPFIERGYVMTPEGRYSIGQIALPRKYTTEEQLAAKNQAKINQEWEKECSDSDEDITMDFLRDTYPTKSQSELNQLMISAQWEDDDTDEGNDEEEGADKAQVKGETSVPERRQQQKRPRGRPRKSVLKTILRGGQ